MELGWNERRTKRKAVGDANYEEVVKTIKLFHGIILF